MDNGNRLASSLTGFDSREFQLRKEIEDYYLPKQLVDAILDIGGIPKSSVVTTMGIAFMDIADYTFLSKFLSPQENQEVLNGLYTAFNSVLKRHGGYLNKIEGDSLMFHYGGIIDPQVKNMSEQEATRYIARELFYTCIEMQRVCVLFNQANDRFLAEAANPETRDLLKRAFDIIAALRSSIEVSSAFNALFQIRIRIGANIGEVTIGNFGPDGAKQWDIVGLPVIEAKRMESTAPVGGLRISERFYRVLEESGVVDAYYDRFRKEARALFGYYRSLTKEELFRYSKVELRDKKDAVFRSYSIEVNPGLPESIRDQAALLLEKGEAGADRIVALLQYYRGNRYVIAAIEDVFRSKDVTLRKAFIFRSMHPRKYDALLRRFSGDAVRVGTFIEKQYSLYELFRSLGRYQDTVKYSLEEQQPAAEFENYDLHMEQYVQALNTTFESRKQWMVQKAYFYNVVFPAIFASIRTSILEFQARMATLEPV
ncbi:MAG: adenylate/guanylate cyclase domain-containing protein [Spirochaetaceae bacterium]|nr:MAG: adenylate/guanylate cyclase domain-containing protein [Spirochaetaceae bacterium]